MPFTVTADKLSTLFEIVINKLKEDAVDVIRIDMNGYWYIPTDEWDNDVTNPAYGSLEEDWEYLENLIEGKETPTYLDFDRLASIIRAISETIIPTASDGVSK